MKLMSKIVGVFLGLTMVVGLGIGAFATNKSLRAKAESSYSTVVNAKVDIDNTPKTLSLASNSSGKYMVDEGISLLYTVSWSSSNTHFTLAYDNANLGVMSSKNVFGTSATLWTIQDDYIYASNKQVQWNPTSSGLRAAPYAHNDSYLPVYLYTAAELDTWCENCNGSQFAFECLYNLLTSTEKAKFSVEGTGYTLPEEQQEEQGDKTATILPDNSAAEAQNDIVLTESPITATISNGIVNTTQIRIYKGKTITIAGATIVKIEFTCTAQNTSQYGPGCFTTSSGYTYSGYVGTWSGNSTSITFTASSNQVRITQIVVTYK